MTKSSPPDWAVAIAIGEARSSSCGRSKRGACAWYKDGDRTVSAVGRNYAPLSSGRPVTSDRNYAPLSLGAPCDKSNECKATCGKRLLHAEEDALLKLGPIPKGLDASMLHVKIGAKSSVWDAVPSGEPSCPECAKLMLVAGFKEMWLLHESPRNWQVYKTDMFYMKTLENLGLWR